jgi:prepilin-type processing-associated H-X9-DG protein
VVRQISQKNSGQLGLRLVLPPYQPAHASNAPAAAAHWLSNQNALPLHSFHNTTLTQHCQLRRSVNASPPLSTLEPAACLLQTVRDTPDADLPGDHTAILSISCCLPPIPKHSLLILVSHLIPALKLRQEPPQLQLTHNQEENWDGFHGTVVKYVQSPFSLSASLDLARCWHNNRANSLFQDLHPTCLAILSRAATMMATAISNSMATTPTITMTSKVTMMTDMTTAISNMEEKATTMNREH